MVLMVSASLHRATAPLYLSSEDGHRLQGAFLLLHLLLQFVDQVLLQRQRSLRLLQSAAQVAALPSNTHINATQQPRTNHTE